MKKREIHLRGSAVATISTPDNVKTKVNKREWQLWGLVGIGLSLLAASLIIHFSREGLNSETFLEWLEGTVGSVGIELLGAGLVTYLILDAVGELTNPSPPTPLPQGARGAKRWNTKGFANSIILRISNIYR